MGRQTSTTGGLFGAALMSPICVLYFCFLILPIGFFLSLSFFTYSAQQMYVAEPTLDNYGRLISDGYYRRIIFDTIRVSLIVTVITLVFGYALAYFLTRVRSS